MYKRQALHDDKLALVALGVIDIVRTIGIIAVVDDLVSAVCLALDFVPVVSAKRDIALPNGVPLKNLKLDVYKRQGMYIGLSSHSSCTASTNGTPST